MGIFDALIKLMEQFLTYCFQFTELIGYPSYGLAIIILTLVIKIVLTPLTIKQVRSMRGMAKLQPRLKEVQARYKNDPKRLQEEMQKLYAETGVNPLSGCLPLIIQMPFLIAIFYAMQSYMYIPEYESFMWLPSLGHPDPMYILPVVSALSTYLVSIQTMNKQDDNPTTKIMQYMMPLFIGYISLNFPSGLVIYWTVSNLFQYVQQLIIFRKEEA